MKKALADFKNEFRKLAAKKKYYVFLIIEAAICIGWGAVSFAVKKMSYGSIHSDIMLSGMSMSMLGFFIQVYIPLIIFMGASDLYTNEYHDGTIRASYMRPVSRVKIYFGKAAAVMAMALIYLVALFAMTTILQFIGTGSSEGMLRAFLSYFIDIIPMCVVALFACFINQLSESSSLSMLSCIIIYIALYAAGVFVPRIGSLLFTGYLMWHNLFIGITIPLTAILSKMGLILGSGMIFGGMGYYLFERREA